MAAALILAAPQLVPQARAADAPAAKSPPTAEEERAPWIVGSTLMNPLTIEMFKHLKDRAPHLPEPRIDARGTSKGVQDFCSGIGVDTPDVVAMSRRMRGGEFESCAKHGVSEIIEIQLGIEALVLAVSARDEDFPLTFDTLYRAIAAELPDAEQFLPNGNETWNDVDKSLPKTRINVILPSSALGARGFFENRFLQGACREMHAFKNIYEADERVRQCTTLRKDGHVSELGVPYDTLAVQALEKAPRGTVAVMPLRFALNAGDKVKMLNFETKVPTRENVSTREYIGTRPIYYYVKRAHVKDYQGVGPVIGLREFITEVTRETTFGEDGYLVPFGLVPMPERKRAEVRDTALRLKPMVR